MTTAIPGAAAGVDRPFLGVLLMVAFCILAPLGHFYFREAVRITAAMALRMTARPVA